MIKEQKFSEVKARLTQDGFHIQVMDIDRPWGGFFVIDEADAPRFIDSFFPSINRENLLQGGKLSPKILLVQPHKKLSWQYHHRRAELWTLVSGVAGLIKSETDQEGELQSMIPGNIITLDQGVRHRLVGLNDWGVIAEIWMHTDPKNPSNEDDIIRIQDDWGR